MHASLERLDSFNQTARYASFVLPRPTGEVSRSDGGGVSLRPRDA
jgi:hypothetical protein